MDQADLIAERGRKKISRFCIEECHSYCCRKGYLILTKNQLDLIVKDKEDYKDQIKKLNKNRFSLFLGRSDKPCPQLKADFKCKIHSNPLRPSACSKFPIFLNKKNKTVLFSPRCLAYNLGLLYPYSKQLQNLGYKIVNVNSIVNLTCLELPDKFVDEKIKKAKLKEFNCSK